MIVAVSCISIFKSFYEVNRTFNLKEPFVLKYHFPLFD